MADEGEKDQKFVCQCFLTHNIFLEEYKAHIVFENDEQFFCIYRKALYEIGCVSEDQWRTAVMKVKEEVKRRQNLGEASLQRKQTILQDYTPKHPQVYQLQESCLSEGFLKIVDFCKREDSNVKGLLSMLDICDGNEIYRLPVFTNEFCSLLIDELKHFEASDLPKGRPNTMNNYGILLNELGFDDDFITPLRAQYLSPITTLLFPEWGGNFLDSHKAFTVQYMTGQDVDLSNHYDNAEVTINVCLGREFTGGQLYFGDMRQVPLQETECSEVDHITGYGILHRGQHMHGALPITTGERCNLIIWMRSSRIRNSLCPMCNEKPRLVKTVGIGDGFTEAETVKLCTTT